MIDARPRAIANRNAVRDAAITRHAPQPTPRSGPLQAGELLRLSRRTLKSPGLRAETPSVDDAAPSETEELLDEIRQLSDMVDKALNPPGANNKLLHALSNVLQARLERLAVVDMRALNRIAR